MQAETPESNWETQRAEMVRTQLEGRGIRDSAVLDAMRSVPREQFMPATMRGLAYSDGAHPIACNQTISQPYMVARMTELLATGSMRTVLEIGTGSGYQTAVLAHLCEHVYTVEWHAELVAGASERLAALGLRNVTYQSGDGSVGWPEHAPYDAIMVTAGAPEVPQPLVDQLAIGGRMVVPTGPVGDQVLEVVHRGEKRVSVEAVLRCRFVRLLGAAGWTE